MFLDEMKDFNEHGRMDNDQFTKYMILFSFHTTSLVGQYGVCICVHIMRAWQKSVEFGSSQSDLGLHHGCISLLGRLVMYPEMYGSSR